MPTPCPRPPPHPLLSPDGSPSRFAGAALLAAALCLAAIVANQTSVHWRVNVVDSDLFAWHGWCVVQGAVPYLDIWDNKPPGTWWLNAAAIRLCGPGSGADVLLGTVALVVTLLGSVAIARRAYGPALTLPAGVAAAVLLTHAGLECGSNRTETFVAACETGAVLGYGVWETCGRRRWLMLAGLCAGAAPLFKQAGLAAGLACAAHLAWARWRLGREQRRVEPWLAFIAGGIVAPLASAAVLATQGALGEAWFAVGPFNRVYFEAGDATWWRMDLALPHYGPVLVRLSGVLLIAAVGLVAGLALRRRCGARAEDAPFEPAQRPAVLGLFVLWFALAFYLANVAPGRRGHHLMPVLPPLTLLVVYPLHLLAGAAGLATQLARRPTRIVLLVLWLFVLGSTAADSLVEARQGWRTKPHWAALNRKVPTATERQGRAVAALTRPDEVIYIWGWSPGTYRYAERRAASRFATFEKLGQVGARARFIFDAAVTDVRRAEPAVMVISEVDRPNLVAERPDIGAWITAEYEEVEVIEGMVVLRRRPRTPPPPSAATLPRAEAPSYRLPTCRGFPQTLRHHGYVYSTPYTPGAVTRTTAWPLAGTRSSASGRRATAGPGSLPGDQTCTSRTTPAATQLCASRENVSVPEVVISSATARRRSIGPAPARRSISGLSSPTSR